MEKIIKDFKNGRLTLEQAVKALRPINNTQADYLFHTYKD